MRTIGLTFAIAASSLASLLAIGCGGEMPPPPPPGQYQIKTFAVGGGQADGTGYVDLTNGQDVSLIAGAQGGFHVYINIRFDMMDGSPLPTSVVIERQARRADTNELVSNAKERRPVVSAMDQSGVLEAEKPMLMFLCPSPVGIQVHDELLNLRVRALADENATTPLAEGTLQLRPTCPEGTLAAHCANICSG